MPLSDFYRGRKSLSDSTWRGYTLHYVLHQRTGVKVRKSGERMEREGKFSIYFDLFYRYRCGNETKVLYIYIYMYVIKIDKRKSLITGRKARWEIKMHGIARGGNDR